MSKRFCVGCGHPYDSDEVRSQRYFCTACGNPLSAEEWAEILAQRNAARPAASAPVRPAAPALVMPAPSPAPRRKKRRSALIPALIALVLCLAVGFGVYAVSFMNRDDDSWSSASSHSDRDDDDREDEEPTETEEPQASAEALPAAGPEGALPAEQAGEHPAQEQPQQEHPAVPEQTRPAVVEAERPTQPARVEIPDCRQEIRVQCSGSAATVTLYEWQDGSWNAVTSNFSAHIGSNGISYDKREGDRCTPAGRFPVLFAFGTKDVTTGLEYVKISGSAVWVDDPQSKYYNTLQNSTPADKDWTSAEAIYDKFSGGASNACICFGFNGDCRSAWSATAGYGSAVFIDGVQDFSKVSSGYGDIKISDADMRALLLLLDASMNPQIVIE